MKKITLLIAFSLCIAVLHAFPEKDFNNPNNFDFDESKEVVDNSNFSLEPNGVTCNFDAATNGDTGTLMINGVSKIFTKRAEGELIEFMKKKYYH